MDLDRPLAYFEASAPFWMALIILIMFVAGFVAIAGGGV